MPEPIAPHIAAGSAIESPDFYRTLVELSPDAIVIHSGGRIVFINQAGLDLLHADRPEQVIGRPVLEFVHPEYREVVQERMRRMREEGTSVPRIQEKFVALDGTEFYGETAAAPFNYQGEPATLVVVHDVTERTRAEEALRESEARFRHLLAAQQRIEEDLARSRDQLEIILGSVDDGITVQDAAGRLVYVNEAAARLVGYPSPEAMLQAPGEEIMQRFEVVDEEGRPVPVQDLPSRRALAGERPPEVVLGFRAFPSGDQRWSIVKAAPVVDERGDVQLAVNVFLDITDRKRAEEERSLRLTQTEEEQQRFAFLAEAGTELASSLDYEATLARVAHLAVRRIADWCVVDLVAGDGSIQRVATAHADPARERWAQEVGQRYLPQSGQRATGAIATGRSQLVPEVTDEMLAAAANDAEHLAIIRSLGMRSAMTVPLITRDRVLGAVTFLSTESGRRFEEDDLALAEELAARAALAIDNARLYREAEAARTRLHDLFMQAPAIVAVARGPEHILELANARFKQLFGNRDMVGLPVREAIPETVRQGIVALVDHVYAAGEPFIANEMPVQLDRHGDGRLEEGYFNFVLQPTRDLEGKIDGVMVHAVEVTEQVRARQQVEWLAAERSAMLGQMTEGVILTDPEGRITFVNEAAQRMYGTHVLDVPIDRYAEVAQMFSPDGEPYTAASSPLARAIRHGETTLSAEVRVRRADGSEVMLERSAAPVRGEDGTLLGAVMTIRDVTALRELERQKDDFLSAAAHDLKTPLTTIKGVAQMLSRHARSGDPKAAARVTEGLARIDATASKMASLVNDLLDVTRIHMNRPLDLNEQPTDLVALVKEVVAEQQLTTQQHRLIVESDLPELTGSWDASRLIRAVTNLLSNAIRYSPRGGEIVVTVSREEGAHGPEAVLTVSDQGLGIPEADLPYIFERFYRGANVAAHVAGTGVGLAGVRQIVEQHGGSIGVQSVEGEGSTFVVRLPASLPAER